ncbi:MAG TPA: dihydrodipicolinate reductase C-terminal domain-containing protein [Terriglobales bacterium]|nr:dihydrodipicolinate reductase C-terminal domain-containing protein [Terriglobales bacterium]
MRLLVLGRGKTGALVASVARERGHEVRVMGAEENPGGAALTPDALRDVDAIIDFTTPQAVIPNIIGAMQAKKPMVVGTTGWYDKLAMVRDLVRESNGSLLCAPNFSIGVNVFFEVARAAAAALKHGYAAHIVERHHAQKKDAPSGTAARMQQIIQEISGKELEITSIREGDVVGTHVMLFDSPNDTMMFTHDAKSRRGFAEGAVVAAEWLRGKQGFFEFKDVLLTKQAGK